MNLFSSPVVNVVTEVGLIIVAAIILIYVVDMIISKWLWKWIFKAK